MTTAVAVEYSTIEHLAKSIGLYSVTDLMAMLTAYTDDSGTHSESEIAVAAGFLSDVGRWGPGKFETDWKVALRVAGILEKGFHTTDFKAGWGPYRNWSEQEKNSLYDALIQAINKHTMFGFSAAVRKDDYDELVTGKLREKLGGHYRFVVAACMFGIHIKQRGGVIRLGFQNQSSTFLPRAQKRMTKCTTYFKTFQSFRRSNGTSESKVSLRSSPQNPCASFRLPIL